MGKEVLLLLVMFWNVENFFDPFENGPVTGEQTAGDHAFTPRGEKFWSWKKFVKKRNDIAKTILLVKEKYGLFPSLIGLAEVENRFVLNQLVQHTLLAPLGYGIIHKDSPDRRGIDVALLYRREEFKPLAVQFYFLKIPDSDSILPSRLILYAKGVFKEADTLHCFVNHWPSKLGGEQVSMPRRMLASNTLKHITDSILAGNAMANIIVMGDFNDSPRSKPVANLDKLINMSLKGGKNREAEGTYKYKESWDWIDHFLISENLFLGKWIFCKEDGMDIFKHRFLIEKDPVYLGEKIRRTLTGPRYNGGVSDHLPVVLKMVGFDF